MADKVDRIRDEIAAYVKDHPDCRSDEIRAVVTGDTSAIGSTLTELVSEGKITWHADRYDSRRRRLRWVRRARPIDHECSRSDPWVRALCSRSAGPCLHGRSRPKPAEIVTGPAAAVRGALRPRVCNVRTELPTRAGDILKLAKRHGRSLDPTQRLVLRDSLRVDGQRWAGFEVALIEPRQSGKNEVVELVELGGVQLWGMKLIVHTAQEVPTTQIALERMSTWADEPGLVNPVIRVVRAPSGGSVEFANGALIRYVARTAAKGRGWSDADMVVFDEAMMSLDPLMLSALTPAMSIAPNPQIWYLASGDLPESVHLRQLRGRALLGDKRLTWLEHSTARPQGRAKLDVTDRRLWYACMPALKASRVAEDFIADQIAVLGEEGFAREYLCVWSDQGGSDLFDAKTWADSADPDGELGKRVAAVFDVNDDMSCALVAASPLPDGLVYAELVAEWSSIERGRRDLPVWLEALKPRRFAWFRNGPAVAMSTELRKHGEPFKDAEVPEVCAELVALVGDGLVHDGSAALWTQASVAVKLPQGKRWVFDRSTGCAGLYAMAGAVREARKFSTRPAQRRVILPTGARSGVDV